MFASLVALTGMYAVLVAVTLAQLLFVLHKVRLDFQTQEENTKQGSEEERRDADGEDGFSLENDRQSVSIHAQSPRQRSQSAHTQIRWDAVSSDAVVCGLDRWSFFNLITDSAIILGSLCTFVYTVTVLSMFLSIAPCIHAGPALAVIYHLNKGALYFIFITRVDNIFSGTAFAYSPRFLRSLMLFNFLGTLGLSMSSAILVKIGSIESRGLTMCQPSMPPLLGMCIVLFDILMSGVSMHLFISPLRKIYAMELSSQMTGVSSVSPPGSPKESQMKQLKRNSQVRRIAVKCRLLTCTAVFFTFVAFAVILSLDVGDFVVWDMIINNLSVIFMTTWVDDYYETVCYIPLKIEWSLKKVCSAIPK